MNFEYSYFIQKYLAFKSVQETVRLNDTKLEKLLTPKCEKQKVF